MGTSSLAAGAAAGLPLLEAAKRRATPKERDAIDKAIAWRVLRPFLSFYEPARFHTAREAAFVALAAIMERIVSDPDVIVTGTDMTHPNERVELQPHLLRRVREIDWVANMLVIGGGQSGVPVTRYENLTAEPPIAMPVSPPAPASRNAASQNRAKPKRIVRKWYQKRILEWHHDRPPSGKDDWADAKAEFGKGARRDVVRKLRAELAPNAWTAKGRRNSRE